jgi:hypothetical protein
MWITQTYLSNLNSHSNIFLYYLWEDYAQQKDIPEEVREGLGELGYYFRDQVAAYVPMRGYLGLIKAEMEEKFRKFWPTFSGKTPGVLLTTKPLNEFDPVSGDWLFFPLGEAIKNPEALKFFFQNLQVKCQEVLSRHSRPEKVSEGSMLREMFDSIQWKITFMGFGYDFKPLISRGLRKIGIQ